MTNFAMVTFPVMVTLTNFTKGDKNATAIYATGYKTVNRAPHSELIII
jgi:hypothetical protein